MICLNEMFLIFFLPVILLISALIDLRCQKIPNIITFPAMIAAVSFHTVMNGLDGFFFSTGGLLTGIGVFILPFLLGGMGAGDAKLMGAAGAVLGPKGAFIAFLFTAIAGGIYALLLILIHHNAFHGFFKSLWSSVINFILTRKFISSPNIQKKNRPRLCYGVAIAVGTLTYVVLDFSGFQFVI